MADMQVDALVIGGGPAGSASACLLRDDGWRVLLVDRAKFPREKACSEYMSPETVRVLDRLGVMPSLRRGGRGRRFGIDGDGRAGRASRRSFSRRIRCRHRQARARPGAGAGRQGARRAGHGGDVARPARHPRRARLGRHAPDPRCHADQCARIADRGCGRTSLKGCPGARWAALRLPRPSCVRGPRRIGPGRARSRGDACGAWRVRRAQCHRWRHHQRRPRGAAAGCVSRRGARG